MRANIRHEGLKMATNGMYINYLTSLSAQDSVLLWLLDNGCFRKNSSVDWMKFSLLE